MLLTNNLTAEAPHTFFFWQKMVSLARLDEVQEELLYYPGVGIGVGGGVGISKMLKFYVKVFYVIGKALSGELSCPCDRSCFMCNTFKNLLSYHAATASKNSSLFFCKKW